MTRPFPAHRETGSLLLTAAVLLSFCVLSVLYKYHDQTQPQRSGGFGLHNLSQPIIKGSHGRNSK